jgi:NitT/TauT family transport system permease protein
MSDGASTAQLRPVGTPAQRDKRKARPSLYKKPPSRARRFWRHPNTIRTTSVVIFLLIWEFYGRRTSPIFLSYPTAIAKAFVNEVSDGSLGSALEQSLTGFGIGFSIAVVAGVLFGLGIGRYRIAYYALDPFITALYNTTAVALIPLIQLWFGFGLTAKIVIVAESCFFPVVYNTSTGVSDVSKDMIDVVRAYGASPRQVTMKVVLPSAIPFIMAGIRLSVGRGIVGIVVAEFFTALSGLGGLIVQYSNNFETNKLFVPVIVLVGLGITLTELAKWLERKIAPWKATQTAGRN